MRMLSKIWERYFLKELIKFFVLFLGCFYGLYVLVDYAGHTSALPHHSSSIPFSEITRYYLFVFSSRADILIPLALLIATTKTLCTLNIHNELVALMASGIRLKSLLRPFILLGLLCTALLFINEQFLLPTALKKLGRIEEAAKSHKGHRRAEMAVMQVALEDGSLLLYQNYDAAKEQFFDAYWIRTPDDLYRIKWLSSQTTPPVGQFVDHLVRLPSGELSHSESFETHSFPDLVFNTHALKSTLLNPDALSLTELWQQLPNPSATALSEKESKILTAFVWKCTIPWLCLLAVMAPAPFCVRFSRHPPVFFIYVCGIFGLIAFFMLMDATQVIAKRQVIAPLYAISLPFASLFALFSWRYLRLR